MSYLYGLDPTEQNRALDDANTHGLDPNSVKPGFFDGMGEAPFTGLFSGAIAKPALALGDAATPMLTPLAEQIDKIFNTHSKEWLLHEQQKNVDMLKSLRERQASYGTASNIVNGFADVVPEAVAGTLAGGPLGGAALTGGLQGYADYRLSMEDGLDQNTAAAKGAITGVTNALGVVLPMAKPGAALVTNLAIGAGANVAMGMAQRGGTAALLEHNGYTDMAKQYQWLDKEAIVTDAILGSAFGGVGHYLHGKAAPDQSHIDAALTTNERLHMEVDTAPGIPKTPEARDAHVEAQIKATEQLLRGEAVDVADLARRVDTLENPAVVERAKAIDEVVRTEYPKEVVDPIEAPKEVVRQPVVEPEPRVLPKDPEAAKPEGPAPKTHDGTPESMAKAADVRPVENDRTRQILELNPDLHVVNEAGELVKAADLVKSLDREIEVAQRESVLHEVAVACFLRG